MIKIHELYNKKQDCCGCELCTEVCPHGVLSMMADDEGFLYPIIVNADNCIDCKRCVLICPMKTSSIPSNKLIKGYGGYAYNELDIKNSSSGGLSTAIGRQFIKSGGIVYGVRYSEDFHSAYYSRATNKEELDDFRTSKYFQARKASIFSTIKTDLKKSKLVLFVGLPCEVSALYNYIGRNYDNLYTISLICHGVTSPLAHKQFCTSIEKGRTIKSFSVRYKVSGWKPYYIRAVYSDGGEYLKPFISTDYEMAFKYLKRPSCSYCKFKLLNKKFGIKADVLIGDFHAQKETDSFYNKWGASQFYACSWKGEELLNNLKDFYSSEICIAGKEWSSPVLSVPTKKLLFHGLYSILFRKYGLEKASNNPFMVFIYKFIQPRIKQIQLYSRKIQLRLFHKVYIW